MATYLVTGGAGFIGSNIVRALVKERQRVRVIDDLSTGRLINLEPLYKEIDFYEGSVMDAKLVRKVLKGADYVLHQAAVPSVARSVADPMRSHEINTTGTVTVLNEIREHPVRCFVFASSSSVYGNIPKLPKREEFKPDPLSPYAVSKLSAEYYIRAFANLYNINAVCLRYFNVFGPHQDPLSEYAAVIPRFISLMLKGERPTIYGDGRQSRDFSYIDNVVSANLLACRNAKNSRGAIANIACGKRYSLLDLVCLINTIIGADIRPRFAPARTGDVKHSLASIAAAKKLIRYKPLVGFREGLVRTVSWMKGSHEA
ncbi:MAG TPA: NAD-dependent epimerase/dehydratase family protein [bacterium]|nr:NAD-dependent epimerase/dehydratase family protein [bacterium]